jgi:chemotaxis response regulator CheB
MLDILSDAIASQPDMTVVGDAIDDVQDSIERHSPDVVIASDSALSDEGAIARLLAAHPHLKVTVIYDGGCAATLFELRQTRLMDPSPKMLLEAIRSALRLDER